MVLPFEATEEDMALAKPAFDVVVASLGLIGARLLPAWDLSEWSRTYVIQGQPTDARWFLKATPRARHESDLLHRLNVRVPEHVPTLLIDDVLPGSSLRWFLMEDAGVAMDGEISSDAANLLMEAVVRIQRSVVDDTVVQRLVPHHEDIVGTLQEFEGWLTAEPASERHQALLARLLDCSAFLSALQEQVDNVRPTLVHPDLFSGNWVIDHGNVRIFDWGDALWTTGGYVVVALVAQHQELQACETKLWETWGGAMGYPVTEDYRRACWTLSDILDLAIHMHINRSCVRTPPFMGAIEQILVRLVDQAETT